MIQQRFDALTEKAWALDQRVADALDKKSVRLLFSADEQDQLASYWDNMSKNRALVADTELAERYKGFADGCRTSAAALRERAGYLAARGDAEATPPIKGWG